jgi:hypothetical protein
LAAAVGRGVCGIAWVVLEVWGLEGGVGEGELFGADGMDVGWAGEEALQTLGSCRGAC